MRWTFNGGPYTTAAQARQCQAVCPPPWPRHATCLVRAEGMSVGASARWLGHPLTVGGLDELTLLHAFESSADHTPNRVDHLDAAHIGAAVGVRPPAVAAGSPRFRACRERDEFFDLSRIFGAQQTPCRRF